MAVSFFCAAVRSISISSGVFTMRISNNKLVASATDRILNGVTENICIPGIVKAELSLLLNPYPVTL